MRKALLSLCVAGLSAGVAVAATVQTPAAVLAQAEFGATPTAVDNLSVAEINAWLNALRNGSPLPYAKREPATFGGLTADTLGVDDFFICFSACTAELSCQTLRTIDEIIECEAVCFIDCHS
ncbi:MAG: hypothetical protein ACFB2Z_02145 [Maricaulaceae bacterium]